ncbi:MAG: hypothetical protein DMF68_02200 [Acidobacteria bacterium]|nr:MAG: hypothetical protein DMF68_02200 [Acidobacteriota bacterium]
MRSASSFKSARLAALLLTLLLTFSSLPQSVSFAQSCATTAENPSEVTEKTKQLFRLERLNLAGGAELLTIFGTAIPFLYSRVRDKRSAGNDAPPPIMDLAAADREVWNRFLWTGLQYLLLDSYGIPLKASTHTFRQNLSDYRKAHVARALALLSLYESETGTQSVFTPAETAEIQARLLLSDKMFGGIVDDINFQKVYEKQTTAVRDTRGHNWELLRQRAEKESLYFEPLEMPDGSATHALLWVARPDLEKNQGRHFDSRFLNIQNPWTDNRLPDWKGYTITRYFDADNRVVAPDTTGAHAVEMIPLALYGLDFPKIPILLVDFRDQLNPKRREMSHRVLQDVARDLLSLSSFANIPYFFGRVVYDFVTSRRGLDLNQMSRLRTYSQLKLLLGLSASFDPELRDDISRRLERVSLNPLENGMETEAKLAREQYGALVAYARRPDGLPARIERDRREEMVSIKHGSVERPLLRLANVLSFGIYTHREKATPELLSQLDIKRQLDFHAGFLRRVVKSTPQIEVVWNIEDVRRSLRFIAEHGSAADDKIASTSAQVFARTEDEETRKLCLNSLYRINNETAKKELLNIYRDAKLEARWREQSAEYLRLAIKEEQRIAPEDAKVILSLVNENQ